MARNYSLQCPTSWKAAFKKMKKYIENMNFY